MAQIIKISKNEVLRVAEFVKFILRLQTSIDQIVEWIFEVVRIEKEVEEVNGLGWVCCSCMELLRFLDINLRDHSTLRITAGNIWEGVLITLGLSLGTGKQKGNFNI